jgi:LPPG:FO 2-phospho-L-lactate transferase
VGPVDALEIAGVAQARPTPEVLDAIARARAIVIGPSNPIVSIGPILAVPGMRDALRAAVAPVVAVSPIVAGQVVKGPTAAFLDWAGLPLSAAGVAGWYGDVLDGMVADEAIGSIPEPQEDLDRPLWELGGPERRRDPALPLPLLRTELLMADAAGRSRLAREALVFAESLRD